MLESANLTKLLEIDNLVCIELKHLLMSFKQLYFKIVLLVFL